MIKIFGEDTKGNPLELKKEVIFVDKFKLEFLVKIDKKLSSHLLVILSNPLDTFIQGNIVLSHNNSMELFAEETAIVRTDFELSKFMVRAPQGGDLSVFLNVCYGEVSFTSG